MYANEKERRLAEMPIPKLFIKLAIPGVIGMLVQGLYIVADRYFISEIPVYGEMAMSGVGVVMPIWIVLFAFSMLVGVGAGANISIYLGKKEKENAEKILGVALAFGLVLSILMIATFLIGMEPFLRLYGATDLNIGYASDYLTIILFGTLWNFAAFSMSNMIRSEGNPGYAMIAMLISSVSNVILDAVFIKVFSWGIKGAAFATILSQFISFSILFYYYLSSKSIIKLRKKNIKLDKKNIYSIIKIGSAPFFLQIAGSVTGGVLNNTLQFYGGELAQGAYAIINSISSMFIMPAFGMNQALQPMIGYNYGAKNYDRLKRTVYVGLIAVSVLFIIATSISMIFARGISSTMADSDVLLDMTTSGYRYVMSLLPFFSFCVVGTTFFQSMGNPKVSLMISLTRQVIVLIPLLLIMPRFMGLSGVWIAIPMTDVLAGIVAAILIFNGLKKIDMEAKESEEIKNLDQMEEQVVLN